MKVKGWERSWQKVEQLVTPFPDSRIASGTKEQMAIPVYCQWSDDLPGMASRACRQRQLHGKVRCGSMNEMFPEKEQ
jgi:hypothetical protein